MLETIHRRLNPKDFVWRPAAAVTSPVRAAFVLVGYLFRRIVYWLCRAATVGVAAIIYRQPRVIYAPAEWTAAGPYRRKTRLIKYRAICHGSLWCDRERIILWISSSARDYPTSGHGDFLPCELLVPFRSERADYVRPSSLTFFVRGARAWASAPASRLIVPDAIFEIGTMHFRRSRLGHYDRFALRWLSVWLTDQGLVKPARWAGSRILMKIHVLKRRQLFLVYIL